MFGSAYAHFNQFHGYLTLPIRRSIEFLGCYHIFSPVQWTLCVNLFSVALNYHQPLYNLHCRSTGINPNWPSIALVLSLSVHYIPLPIIPSYNS